MTPTFTITIGSCGRPGLRTMLESIARQRLIEGDQCLVGLDAHKMTIEEVAQAIGLVAGFGPGFHAIPYVGVAQEVKVYPDWPQYRQADGSYLRRQPGEPYSWLGVEQINHLLRNVEITGSHVFTIGDDDIFVDGAYDVLREVCATDPLRPVIYKFVAPNRWLLWDRPRMRSCLISGCCIAAPRKYVGFHPTEIATTHDYVWMSDILLDARMDHHPEIWLDYVGVIARPDPWGAGVKHRGVYQCPKRCGMWSFLEDVRSTNRTHCPNCGAWWTDENPAIIVEGVDPALGNWYEQEGARR